MRRLAPSRRHAFAAVLLFGFAACADATEGAPDGAPSDAGPADSSHDSEAARDVDASDAGADADADPSALRCDSDFCLVDLPNPNVHGFSKWMFAGVAADPAIGVWAIANGVLANEAATAQVLRLENGAFQVVQTVKLLAGAEERNVKLGALAGDGAGNLLAVGNATGGGGVILHGDGGVFTVESFDADLRAAWFAGPRDAWIAGGKAAIFRSGADGGWESESADAGVFASVWGSGPDDVYVGGAANTFPNAYGLLGHRTIDDAGTPRWSFEQFPKLQTIPMNERVIRAGIAQRDGARFWASQRLLARAGVDAGQETWALDAFKPPVALRAFWAHRKDDIWAVGEIGRVYHYDGTTWTDLSLSFNGAPLTTNLTGITGTSDGEIFIVGEDVALRRKAP